MLRQVRLSEAGVENEDLGFNAESKELRIYFSKILNSSWLHGTKVRLNIIKLSKPAHRYGKVIEVIEDDNGLVRDAVVATRSRRRKEKPGQYVPGPVDHQLVAVQRLVLLLPKEQQDQLPAEEPGLHVCEETLQVPDHHEDLATVPPLPPVLQLLPLNVPQTRLWMRLSPWTRRSSPSTASSPRPSVSKSTWRSSSTAWTAHCSSPTYGNQISVKVIS